MALPFSDLQSVAPSAIIELFQLELNVPQHGVDEIYYFHAGVNIDASADIIWNGKTYLAFPLKQQILNTLAPALCLAQSCE
jgi:phage-related protein